MDHFHRKIFITALFQDFTPTLAPADSVQPSDHASYCREYAVITETNTAAIVERCHGDPRTKNAYLSFSHRVQVEIRAPAPAVAADNIARPSFVIHYQGEGIAGNKIIGCLE